MEIYVKITFIITVDTLVLTKRGVKLKLPVTRRRKIDFFIRRGRRKFAPVSLKNLHLFH